MDIKETYKQLTGVDIEKQKYLWDERGKGYYGEFLVFCELYKYIAGKCKLLMNLQIPVDSQKTTEIDLIMIHETGLYVFEIKHYKGTIYGKIPMKNGPNISAPQKTIVLKTPYFKTSIILTI